MATPNLTPTQKRVLDLALTHWASQGVWPERVQIKARLRAEGLDYKAALAENLWPLAQTGDWRSVKLSIFGAAVAEGGEPWIRYFIPLVKRAIELFLQNPHGDPHLTDAHLREVAQGEPAEKMRRLSELYMDELLSLGGSLTHGGDGCWQARLTTNALRYRGVDTVFDFLERKQVVHNRLRELGHDHRRMALSMYETWRQNGEGPTSVNVVMNHLDLPDPVATWEEMPSGLFTEEFLHSKPARPVNPTLSGLVALRPETDAELHALVAILSTIRDIYLGDDATKPPSLREVATRVNVTPEQVIRLLELTPSMPHVGISLEKRDGELQFKVDEAIFEIDKVKTLDGFLGWISEKKKDKERWIAPPVSPLPTTPSPTLSGQQLTLYKSLAARDERLASMYLGALVVLIDDRNPDRIALAAHGLRELMEKIPAHLDVAMRAHSEGLGEKIRPVEDAWRAVMHKSKCRQAGNDWQGEIDAPMRVLLIKLSQLFEWMSKHIPRRRDEVSATLRNIDPAKKQLPGPLEKLNVDLWIKMRNFFVDTAHHRARPSSTEFDQWCSALARFLIDGFVPRTFEDFAEIDTIIAGGGTSDDA